MERITGDIEGLHGGDCHLDALLIGALIKSAFDFEAFFGGCGADQFYDGDTACERSPPVSSFIFG